MGSEPGVLERDAYSFLSQEKFEEAFKLFNKAAKAYRNQNNHEQAALCFASAASCWSKKSGEKTFYNAALSYEEATMEAEKSGDFAYASMLYKYAAINSERDGEFLNFSDCFYRSKECYRKFLTYRLIKPSKIHPIVKTAEDRGIKGFLKHLFLWFMLTFSFIIWGHGERPARTFFAGILIIFSSVFLYILGHLLKDGAVFSPSFFEALYFSVITFTTVGYGDVTPIGLSQLVAACESFFGLFIIPIFVIGLARKYLRI